MLFGDKDQFAVQAEIDEHHGGVWLFGKFCYWITGNQIGNYDLGTSLRDVWLQMHWVVRDCGNRKGGPLCRLEPKETFVRLDELLYGPKELVSDSISDLIESPARFDIRIPVDTFDEWKLYLLECDSSSLILYRNVGSPCIELARLRPAAFETAIVETFHWLSDINNAFGETNE